MRGPKTPFKRPQAPAKAGTSRVPPGHRSLNKHKPKPVPGVIKDDQTPKEPAVERARPLDGEGRPYITLAQLIKANQLAPTGGAAKQSVREGGILVNGQPENRPGRKLHHGDVVTIGGEEFVVEVQ